MSTNRSARGRKCESDLCGVAEFSKTLCCDFERAVGVVIYKNFMAWHACGVVTFVEELYCIGLEIITYSLHKHFI